MENSELFQKNLKRWALTCPWGEKSVSEVDGRGAVFFTSDSGHLNLKCSIEDSVIYLHSRDNPTTEAAHWFSELHLKDIDVIYVYGVGLGYYYEAAKEWLNARSNHSLVFFEENAQVIHRLLETELGTRLVNDRQTSLYFVKEGTEGLKNISDAIVSYALYNFIPTALKSYAEHWPDRYKDFKNHVSFFVTMNKANIMEYSGYGLTVSRNYFLNYLDLTESRFANQLIGKFKNIPAIICGAGPSLDKNIHLLGELGDRALIFAGGTALNALNAHHIMPHFGVGIDPNRAQFTRLIMNQAFEIPFLYRSRMLHEALEIIHGDKLFVTGMTSYAIGKWVEEKLGIAQENELQEGFNVLNFSVSLAHVMGCNPIILVGIDLAYSAGESYASGIVSHPLHDRRNYFRTKTIEDDLITKPDINGFPVFTQWKWLAESFWYSLFRNEHPQTLLINATEGGIGFPGILNMTLKDVQNQFLAKQYDIKTFLQGEIQNSSFPKEITFHRLVEILDEFVSSLQTSASLCEKIIADYSNKLKIPSENQDELKGVDSLIAKNEQNLSEETAYQIMLSSFKEALLKIQSLEAKRLKLDEEFLPKNEIQQKVIDLKIQLYRYLQSTASVTIKMIQDILQSKKNEETLSSEAHSNEEEIKRNFPIPAPIQGEVYSFDRQTLTMIDPEINLNYQEGFSPEPDDVERLYYSNGNLKLEQFYRRSVLHGPSTYFSEQGLILSRSWFLEGKRQGKMHTYYLTGDIHSIQRFKNNVPDGIQEYFYPDGFPRSFFSYAEGKIHGDVSLFHPKGILARRLYFVHGKRDGLEQIWDRIGQIRVEASYSLDRPINVARAWHPNGQLVKEIVFDSNSKRIEERSWDLHGKLIQEESKQEDYFDQMTKETISLTDNLNNVFEKMCQVVSYLKSKKDATSQQMDSSEPAKGSFDQEMKKLNLQMQHLHELSQQIHLQTNVDELNPKEELWKNPLSRQELERNISPIGKQMNDELKTLEQSLKKVLDNLTKRDKGPSSKNP